MAIEDKRTTVTSVTDWQEEKERVQDNLIVLRTMQEHIDAMAQVMKSEKQHLGFDLRPLVEVLTQASIEDSDILIKPLLRAYSRAIHRTETTLKNIDLMIKMCKE